MHQFWLIIERAVEIELGLRVYPAVFAVTPCIPLGARPNPLPPISCDFDFIWDVWLAVALDFEAQSTPRQTVPHCREILCKDERLVETVRTAKLDRCRKAAPVAQHILIGWYIDCSAIDFTKFRRADWTLRMNELGGHSNIYFPSYTECLIFGAPHTCEIVPVSANGYGHGV
jgi:hypothetical protein